MLSYNEFNWVGGYTGRKGATKMVILETDGVANQKCNGNFQQPGRRAEQLDGHLERGERPEPDERAPAGPGPGGDGWPG